MAVSIFPMVCPKIDPAPIFELFRGNYATELLTAAVVHFHLFEEISTDQVGSETLRTKLGFEKLEPSSQYILDELKASRGFLRLNDDSHPEDIKTVLKMSKKTFKKAIGALYKEKLIEIKDDGIYLIKE